ncbi:MAG: DUF1707 domain-containing protein [Micropruina sp.]
MTYTEPSDVGPAVGGDLPVAEADRQAVINLLTAARDEGRLSPSDHDQRQQAALYARTFDDLVPLTRDLVAPRSAPLTPSPADPDLIVSILGSTHRTGPWEVRRHISALSILGSAKLDLTQAVFLDNVCEVSVFCLLGDVTVIVPDGVSVRNECISILGDTGVKWLVPPVPGAPTVILKGVAALGDAKVRGATKRP